MFPSWIRKILTLERIVLKFVEIVPFLTCFEHGRKLGDVTVFWVSPSFGYPRTQNTSVLGIPLQYDFSVLGIPRYPPPVPKSLVFWVTLSVSVVLHVHFWYCYRCLGFELLNYGFVSSTGKFKIGLNQGLEGVLRDPGIGRNRARDSGIQEKSSRDS